MDQPVKFIPNVDVPMRDGVILRADLYGPDDDLPHPVIVARTPYNKQLLDPPRPWLRFAAEGYVVVVQDCRGRFASDGVFYPFLNEMEDGYDTVEWAAVQPWSTGKTGMYGTSYLGVTQWLAAAAAPPHLTTIVPSFTACDYHDGWTYQSGALLLSFTTLWILGSFAMNALSRSDLPHEQKGKIGEAIRDVLDDEQALMERLPLDNLPILKDHNLAPYYGDFLAHPDGDEYWSRWNIARFFDNISIPVLALSGWYDMFLGGTLRNFLGMQRRAIAPQRLVIGPWHHGRPLFGPSPNPEIGFGVHAGMDVDGMALRWFDRWLKGVDNGADSESPLTIYTLGSNRWRTADSWPPRGVTYVEYYLHSDGAANGLAGDGALSPIAPGAEPPDAYRYDPRKPVPTKGGGAFGYGGPWDQRGIEARSDVLVYTSAALENDLEATGPLTVTLWAATTAKDTDFTAKLVDVAPDGRAIILADNIVRARYRDGTSKGELVEPGKAYRYTIDLYGISNVFKKGHRIRVDVSSSNFPRFDRNPNTGRPVAAETELVPAAQTVFHDSQRPSHVRLPVIPR